MHKYKINAHRNYTVRNITFIFFPQQNIPRVASHSFPHFYKFKLLAVDSKLCRLLLIQCTFSYFTLSFTPPHSTNVHSPLVHLLPHALFPPQTLHIFPTRTW